MFYTLKKINHHCETVTFNRFFKKSFGYNPAEAEVVDRRSFSK